MELELAIRTRIISTRFRVGQQRERERERERDRQTERKNGLKSLYSAARATIMVRECAIICMAGSQNACEITTIG